MQVLKTEEPNINDKIDQFEGSIFLNVGKHIQRISLDSIEYIKGYGDYMKVMCNDRSYTVHITMKNLQSTLPQSDFFRIHKSYIINMNMIDVFEGSEVTIRDEKIPIGKTYLREFKKKLKLI